MLLSHGDPQSREIRQGRASIADRDAGRDDPGKLAVIGLRELPAGNHQAEADLRVEAEA
jgi:hypothetical protein